MGPYSRLPEDEFRLHLPLGEVLKELGMGYFGSKEFPLVPQMTFRPAVDAKGRQVINEVKLTHNT